MSNQTADLNNYLPVSKFSNGSIENYSKNVI